MNTTTCAHCGNDFRDRDMLPLPQGGELCADCMEKLCDAAPELLAALRDLEVEAMRHASHPVSDHRPYFTTMAARARAAIAKATKE